MIPRLPKIAFVSPHCLVDFTNGAATATLDALTFLQSLGFPCMAFCNSRLDAWEEVLIEEALANRGLPYEVRNAQIGAFRGRMIFTAYRMRKGDSPIFADTKIGTVPTKIGTVPLPVTLFNSASTRGGWLNREEIAAFLTACDIFLKKNRPDLVWTYGGDGVSRQLHRGVRALGIPLLFRAAQLLLSRPLSLRADGSRDRPYAVRAAVLPEDGRTGLPGLAAGRRSGQDQRL